MNTDTLRYVLSRTPVIRNPSFKAPDPVQVDSDAHALPENLDDYFVYDYSLESQVVNSLGMTRAGLKSAHELRIQEIKNLNQSRSLDKQRRLSKLAPGYVEGASVMEPKRVSKAPEPAPEPSKSEASVEDILRSLSIGVGAPKSPDGASSQRGASFHEPRLEPSTSAPENSTTHPQNVSLPSPSANKPVSSVLGDPGKFSLQHNAVGEETQPVQESSTNADPSSDTDDLYVEIPKGPEMENKLPGTVGKETAEKADSSDNGLRDGVAAAESEKGHTEHDFVDDMMAKLEKQDE